MSLTIVDITPQVYEKVDIGSEEVILSFDSTEILMDLPDWNKLKRDIIEQEGLARVEFNVAIDENKTPKREILLKELIKTIDKIDDLTREYDEKYMESRGDAGFLTPSEEVKLKKELYPLHKEKNRQIAYKQKLEAQLEYGDLK